MYENHPKTMQYLTDGDLRRYTRKAGSGGSREERGGEAVSGSDLHQGTKAMFYPSMPR